MMLERGDFQVFHEPFTSLFEFGRSHLNGRRIRTQEGVVEALFEASRRAPVFFKDTSEFRYPVVLSHDSFLRSAVHTFMIRDPREAIASHYALEPNLDPDRVGFRWLHEMYLAVLHATGSPPVIIDSGDLVDQPETVVKAYCEAVGIPYLPGALKWRKGPRIEWQQTSRWHRDVVESTGFERIHNEYDLTVENSAKLAAFCKYSLPFYEDLYSWRLVPSKNTEDSDTRPYASSAGDDERRC